MSNDNPSARDHENDQTGSDGAPTEPSFFVVGKVIKPHGIRGEMKLDIMTSNPDWIKQVDVLYVGNTQEDSDAKEYEVKGMRYHRKNLLIKLAGIEDRNAAELMRNKFILMRPDQAEPLADDEFYAYELIGMPVHVDSDDELLGTIQEIMQTGANDVYVVQGGARGTILIPDIEMVIKSIDLDNRKMIITPLDGMFD